MIPLRDIWNLPSGVAGMFPSRMVCRNGNLYLADLFAKQVVVTDANGRFQEGYDINRLVASAKVEEEKPGAEKNHEAAHPSRRG
jgi:hypothetical protein